MLRKIQGVDSLTLCMIRILCILTASENWRSSRNSLGSDFLEMARLRETFGSIVQLTFRILQVNLPNVPVCDSGRVISAKRSSSYSSYFNCVFKNLSSITGIISQMWVDKNMLPYAWEFPMIKRFCKCKFTRFAWFISHLKIQNPIIWFEVLQNIPLPCLQAWIQFQQIQT